MMRESGPVDRLILQIVVSRFTNQNSLSRSGNETGQNGKLQRAQVLLRLMHPIVLISNQPVKEKSLIKAHEARGSWKNVFTCTIEIDKFEREILQSEWCA